MRTIKLKKFKVHGSGCYGDYIKLSSRRGIKIHFGDDDNWVDKIKDVKRTSSYKEARACYRLMKKLNKITDMIPKAYGVAIVKHGNRYAAGTVMQHINGPTYGSIIWTSYGEESKPSQQIDAAGEAYEALRKELDRKNIVNNDFGGNNVVLKDMSSPKNFKYIAYSIDIDPQHVKLQEDKKKRRKKRR